MNFEGGGKTAVAPTIGLNADRLGGRATSCRKNEIETRLRPTKNSKVKSSAFKSHESCIKTYPQLRLSVLHLGQSRRFRRSLAQGLNLTR